MEEVIWVLILVLGLPIGLALWLIVRAVRAARDVQELRQGLHHLAAEVRALHRSLESRPPAPQSPEQVVPATEPVGPVDEWGRRKVSAAPAEPIEAAPAAAESAPTPVPPAPTAPPPLPPPLRPARPPVVELPPDMAAATAGGQEPPPPLPPPAATPAEPARPSINWEQFMGVKLAAWIGGFVLFLAVVFGVKYSFDNNLISPEVRVAIGYCIGVGLLVGGLVMNGRKFLVLGQTLCATSTLVLYANTFAAAAFYRPHLIGIVPAFAVMALITATAFILAVRLDAQVVAILGLLGGFMTPVLLSTGKDNALGLFTYIGLLDAGLIGVVTRKRWSYLLLLAAIGTALMQFGWVDAFFTVEKVYTGMWIFLSMEALFLVAFVVTQQRGETNPWIAAAAFLLAATPLVFTLKLLSFRSLGECPWLIFTYVLAADLGLLALAWLRTELRAAHLPTGGAVFFILTCWTLRYLTDQLLNWALGYYLVFAILHSVVPVVMQRLRPGRTPAWWAHLFPLLALLLVMVPIFRLTELSFLVWFFVLVVDLLVIGLAVATTSALAILGALVLTIGATAAWILKVPAKLTGLPDLLVVIGGFALVFFVLATWATRKLVARATAGSTGPAAPGGRSWASPSGSMVVPDLQVYLPALSAILPFLLLIMVAVRLPLANPSPVFGLALLLVVLLLGIVRIAREDALALVGLVCVLALEHLWHQHHFKPEFAAVPLAWYLVFTVIFLVFPFLFVRRLQSRVIPWAAAALSGPLHFYLVYDLFKAGFPNPVMGLLPAAFAVPLLAGLIVLLRVVPAAVPARAALLAWFGGATLFFITLIFPIQFDREWIIIGWAMEGAALLWLFHRVPHPGLRLVGVALLVIAFGRMLDPGVLQFHPRSATPVLNWYLYTYGIITVCLMLGGWLLAPPRNRVMGTNAPPLLFGLGTVLAFLLVNIEIADYFSTGKSLTFQFHGNFARDMTYSIAWALFALTLLVVGIARKQPAARYASLGLLCVTLLKLFFHDLLSLSQLYRIGAFIAVAVILLVSSFLYQRFVATTERKS